uniref:DUF928 domain-containing protein n=1 Tax=Cyanothece sp. (strain PCC 7425 / ATCC 29141) TaxID=395961 RepID=B8HTM6_CYAP4
MLRSLFCVPCLSLLLLGSLPSLALPRSEMGYSSTLASSVNGLRPRLQFRLPSRGMPGSRIGGATRGDCVAGQQTLTALIPNTNLGLTTTSQPTIFLYVPKTIAKTGELILMDQALNTLGSTRLALPTEAGIMGIRLPVEMAANIKPGQSFQWSFSLLCDPEDPSSFITVEGGIERIQPTAGLEKKLQAAPQRDRLLLYADAGLWYETLSTLAELQRSYPQDNTLKQEWSELLGSIGLNAIAAAPLVAFP